MSCLASRKKILKKTQSRALGASPGTVSHQHWAAERAVPWLQTRGEGKATKSLLPPRASLAGDHPDLEG